MKRRTVVLALVILTAVCAIAADKNATPFEFQGLRLGMALSQVQAAFPNARCEDRAPEVVSCVDERGDGPSAETYTFTFFQGKLARVNIWFPNTRYREVREQILRAFGKPTTKPEPEMSKKNLEVFGWYRRGPDAMAVLEQVSPTSPDKCSIYFNDDAMSAEVAKRLQ